jgi:hypothetical protein
MRIMFPRTGVIVSINNTGGVTFENPLGGAVCLGCKKPLCNLDCQPSKESRLFEVDLARGKRLLSNGMRTGFEIAMAAVLQFFRTHAMLENDQVCNQLCTQLDIFLSQALADIDHAST